MEEITIFPSLIETNTLFMINSYFFTQQQTKDPVKRQNISPLSVACYLRVYIYIKVKDISI